MPRDTEYGPRDTNDEVERQVREEKRERAEETNAPQIKGDAGYYMGPPVAAWITERIEKAVLDERERCARIAEEYADNPASVVAENIAKQIRSGE